MAHDDWQARTRAAQQGLAPLGFLIGRWAGEGHSHGEPVTAILTVRPCLGETFVEAREQMFTADGTLDHEDISFYRYDDREGHLRVRQLMAPAHISERMVLPRPDGGIRWYEGPLGVQVHFIPGPDGSLTEKVVLPLQSAPAVLLTYRRAQ